MDVAIAYFIAIFSISAFLALWFVNVYKALFRKKSAVCNAQKELRLHQSGYQKKRGSPEEATAKHMLDTSARICEQIQEAYNSAFKNPFYRIPGILMGFKNLDETKRRDG